MNKILIVLGTVLLLVIAFWIWHKRFHAMVFFKSLDNLKKEVSFVFLGKQYTLRQGEALMANGYNLTAKFLGTPEDYHVEITITKSGNYIRTQRYPNY